MQYTEDGFRIYAETEDTSGVNVRIERSGTRKPAVQVDLSGYSDVIELDRQGAVQAIAGLTAFLADTDGVPDLPEPDAER